MRVFIYNMADRSEQGKPPLYEFTRSVEASYLWKERETANWRRRSFEELPIAITTPLGQRLYCEDYRVEERPQGGFCISCLHPIQSTHI